MSADDLATQGAMTSGGFYDSGLVLNKGLQNSF